VPLDETSVHPDEAIESPIREGSLRQRLLPRRLLRCVLCVVALARIQPAVLVHAQTLTGNVDGRVTDRNGAALPGATVHLSGSALMDARTAHASADGSYRFDGLPPGVYALTFSCAGFRPTSSAAIRVGAAETATVNAVLNIAAYEGVTVSADLLALDRRSTMVKTTFDPARLEQVPGSRTADAILAMTPSVQQNRFDVGGNAAMTPIPFSAYGIAGTNRPTLEGISISGINGYGVGLDYGSFEQVSVGAAAYGPEWPSAGVHLQFITKSGGNEYRGVFYAAYESGQWQAHNIDADQVARGAAGGPNVAPRDANRLAGYHDINADIGGFVRRDRLWWYASVRQQHSSAAQIAFAPSPLQTDLAAGSGKLTSRLGEFSRAVVFAYAGQDRQPIRLDAFLRPATALNESRASTSDRVGTGVVWKAEWTADVTNRLFIEARAGQFSAQATDRPNGTAPRFEDVVDPLVTGGNRDWYQSLHSTQASATLSYLFERWGGLHHVMAGGDLQSRVDAEAWNVAYPGDVLQVLRDSAPWEVYLFQAPSRSESGQRWYAGYANDAWQWGPRLTLNLGLRVDHWRAFLPEQQHPAGRFNPVALSFAAVPNLADWTAVAPRLGASFDLFGHGRTLLKTSYGRYVLPPGNDLGFNANPNSSVWWTRYKWSDTNANGVWDDGEQSLLLERRGGEAGASIDPALKLAFVREGTARIEHEVVAGFRIQSGVIWRAERQQGSRQRASWPFDAFTIVKTINDPGPDARFGTADDGAPIQVYDLPTELLGLSGNIIRNSAYGDSDYLTWEAVAERQASRRWSLSASFSHTWQHDQAAGYLGQPVRANEFPATPNDLIGADTDGRHVFTTWTAKAYATYDAPWGITVAPVLRHQSGQPFGRTLFVPLDYGTVRVLAEPIGTRRQRALTVMDVRVSKSVPMRAARSVTVFVEVFNLFNANAEEIVSWSTNDFLRPLTITPPRIARCGVRIGW
jgi:hypothetical protein